MLRTLFYEIAHFNKILDSHIFCYENLVKFLIFDVAIFNILLICCIVYIFTGSLAQSQGLIIPGNVCGFY